jgi:peptide/nickel transport system ATP-binding protein
MHPYTQGLMAAVPKLTGGGVSDGIPGRMPAYLDPPQGCRFHPRCPHVMDICKQEKPAQYKVDADQQVACFLYEDNAADGSTAARVNKEVEAPS